MQKRYIFTHNFLLNKAVQIVKIKAQSRRKIFTNHISDNRFAFRIERTLKTQKQENKQPNVS